MSDPPKSAADPRPNGEPYYIDSACPNCGKELVLNDIFEDNDSIWHDEWVCPKCVDGLHMDWPEAEYEELERRTKEAMEGEFHTLEEVEEELDIDE